MLMRDVNARLSALRELVYEQPSALDWEALRRLLSRWRAEHPESLALGLDYASVRLSSWPAPWRRVECRDPLGLVAEAPEAAWPLVRQLLLYEIPAGRGVPHGLRGRLEGVSYLELWFKAPEPALARLWASGELGAMEGLVVRGGLEARGAQALGHAPMPRLMALDLDSNPLGDAGARALAALPMSPGLRRLDLRQCDIGLDGLQALADAPWIDSLERLVLGGNRVAPWHQVVLDRLAPTTTVVWD